ncbi:zinc-ribbon domain-containing protein [Miniphocaeibacter massiliensis]|uniref:zinc-ribbon domain-containing protein n=1 Tax=Miniphocaeibacter massiliensis TaxID=2041841 RepID=UPI000C1BA5EF|nr:zinc ribbon domain-containing protein [Miniphocaeibacter massiliensis]
MFFIFGIADSYDEVDFKTTFTCECCNHMEQMNFYMFYTYFSLFFIKIFKWNKRYVGVCRNCNCEYEFTKETFEELKESGNLKSSMYTMRNCNSNYGKRNLVCSNCGYTLREDFEFCPKCGSKL